MTYCPPLRNIEKSERHENKSINNTISYDCCCINMSAGPQGVPRRGTFFIWLGVGTGKAHQSADANPCSDPKPRAFVSHSYGLITIGSGYSFHLSGFTNLSFFRHQQLHVLSCQTLEPPGTLSGSTPCPRPAMPMTHLALTVTSTHVLWPEQVTRPWWVVG